MHVHVPPTAADSASATVDLSDGMGSAAPPAAASVDKPLLDLLQEYGLVHLVDILGPAISLADCHAVLDTEGRVPFFALLKQIGVSKLGDRQGLANAIGKARKKAGGGEE